MRVAIISSGLISIPPIHGGAVEEYVYQLTRHLRAIGVDAVAVDFTLDKVLEYVEHDGALIAKIPITRFTRLPRERIIQEYFFGLRASRYIRDLGVDIVHANTAWAGFALAMTLSNGMPLVYTCHNPLWPEEKVSISEHIVRLVEGYIMRKSKATIALNRTMMKSIAEKAHVDRRKIFITPNGVDTEFFKPGIVADDVVKKYRLEGKRMVLFVGRVTFVKGVHLLLKAFKKLAFEYNDLKLVIAGPLTDHFNGTELSPYARKLMEYAKRVLPKGSYIFTGPIDRETLRKLYSAAYVCVLPSYVESFGMVLIEAMSSGCPVIGSSAGGIVDVIDDDITGFIFRMGDHKDLKKKLEMLVNDEMLRKIISANCRRIVKEKYGWRVVATKLRKVYKDIIAKYSSHT